MNLQTIFNVTSPDVNLSELIFDALLKTRQIEIIDNYDDFGFWCILENHEIGFFLKGDELEIERFGFSVNKKWIDLKVTKSQKDKMMLILQTKKEDLIANEITDNLPYKYVDIYNETGTNELFLK